MAETCVKISASIRKDQRDYLEKKKSDNPREYPGDSFFIQKGLDSVIYGEKNKVIENLLFSILSLVLGFLGLGLGLIILFLFTSFNSMLFIVGFLVMGAGGMVMVLSSIRFKRVYKLWRR